jgi:ABC-type multidrug transport system fused ATPase/permease subunit
MKNILINNYRPLILIVFLTLLTATFNVTSVLGLMPIIDFVTNPELNSNNRVTIELVKVYKVLGITPGLLTLGLFYLFLILIKAFFLVFEKYITAKTIMRIMKDLIFDQYQAYLDASWSFFGKKEYGMLSNTIAKETEKAATGLEALAQLIASSFSLICFFMLLLFISWELTGIVFLVTLSVLLPISFFLNSYVYRVRTLHTKASNEFQGKIYDTLNSIKLIIGFSKKKNTFDEVSSSVLTVTNSAVKFTMARVILQPITEILVVILIVISVTYGLSNIELGIPSLVAFLYSIQRLGTEAQAVMNSRNGITASLPSFEQIGYLKKEALLYQERKTGTFINSFTNSISIQNLSFSYDKDNRILEDISINISKGSMVGIVGPSGSGKSSLIDLILGFHLPDKGKILIDDINLNELKINDWRNLIGYIPQQPFLFNLSIKENLLWSNKDAQDIDIKKACKLANAHEFIEALDNGYETIVGERGARLSGGQAQRICLARALAKNPKILVLDEATSSLDSNSENLIQKSIEDLAGEITIISIAHRLATIKSADNIYNLRSGNIIESGNFEELMANKNGDFYKSAVQQGIIK